MRREEIIEIFKAMRVMLSEVRYKNDLNIRKEELAI
jgi:hypothetical protein